MIRAALAAAVAVALALPSAAAATTRTPCGPVRAGNEATARLQIAGTHMQSTDGTAVQPYGISVVSGPETVNWRRSEKAVAAQIDAAHDYWHANAVRIQVSEKNLFKRPTRGYSYNVAFAQSVDRLICRVLGHGDIPVLNDTTIFTGRERGPGPLSIRFWRFMSQRWGNTFPVIFDLFNEPQVTRNARTGRWLRPSDVWRVWHSGGTVGGIRYMGMQDLVDEIRVRQHASNVIWAEEPYYVAFDQATLNLLPQHLLAGADIVYAFHKPNLRESSRSYTDLQKVAAQGVPLVNSEWGQYAATDRPWMCQSDAYQTVPRFLQFLHDASIGLVAWSLQPGALVKGKDGVDTVHDGNDWRYTQDPRALAQPNEMKPDYGCTPTARGQGVGQLVMDYFASLSVRPPASLFPKLG